MLDSARVDRRGLVLLRYPHGMGRDLGALQGKVFLGKAAAPLPVEVPAGVQHVVARIAIDPADAVGVHGGTRLAMLRWMKNSPESAPKIEVTCTRLSQQEMIIARGCCPSSARRRYQLRFSA